MSTASMNTSIPLFLYSYLPPMPMRMASSATGIPDIAEATCLNLSLAAERLEAYSSSVAGVKLFSKPLGVTTSIFLPRK